MASSSTTTGIIVVVAIILLAAVYYVYSLVTALGVHTTLTQSLIDQKIVSPNGINFSTTTGTGTNVQTTLKEYWEDIWTTDFKYNGVVKITGVQFKLTRIGKQVTIIQLTSPDVTAETPGAVPADSIFMATTSFPDRYKPVYRYLFPVLVLNNSIPSFGVVGIYPNEGTTPGGSMYVTGTNSTNFVGGFCGWYTISGSYNIA